eukprot:6611433-Pyramimonas_sp.AAC.2
MEVGRSQPIRPACNPGSALRLRRWFSNRESVARWPKPRDSLPGDLSRPARVSRRPGRVAWECYDVLQHPQLSAEAGVARRGSSIGNQRVAVARSLGRQ